MKRHAKASSAGSNPRQASRLGRFFRGALATRGASSDATGTGACSQRFSIRLLLPLAAFFAMALAPAAHASPYENIGSFAGTGGNASDPARTAADTTTGYLFAGASGSESIEVFKPTETAGEPLSPPSPISVAPFKPYGIAVDSSNGDVYFTHPGLNEKQTFNRPTTTECGGAGTKFTLTFGTKPTTELACGTATNSAIQSALNALSSIGGVSGSVVVSGSSTAKTVEFKGSLGNTDIANEAIEVKKATGGALISKSSLTPHVDGFSGGAAKYLPDNHASPTSYAIDGSFTSPAEGSGAGQVSSYSLAPEEFPVTAIAVDPTGAHDILIADIGQNKVKRFSSSGAFKEEWDGSSSGSAFGGLQDIAVNSAGKVVAADFLAGVFRVVQCNGDGTGCAAFASPPPNVTLFGFNHSMLAVDQSTDEVFVTSKKEGGVGEEGIEPIKIYRYSSAGASIEEFTAENAATTFSGTPFGMANTGGLSPRLYVTATEAFLGATPPIQVFAPTGGVEYPLTVTKTGAGTGTVTSSPAGISCGLTCSAEFEEETEVTLGASEDPGSEFTGWTGSGCSGTGTCVVTMSEAKAVEANFDLEPVGPTNRRLLTVTKSAGGTGGVGTVKSKPKGINCATACNEAVGSFYKEGPVTLSAKPATGSSFVKWSNPGGACDESASVTCVMPIAEDESVEALFTGVSKAILSPTALTLSKGESTGFGTVKATGLYCEAECTQTTVLYQGTITEPKPKAAKTVELSQVPLYGSEFSGWSGCDSEAEGKCIVTMSAAKEVTAEYTAKPNVALTLEKGGAGTGTVTSKPKGVKCAVTCTTQTMSVPSGEAVILKAKAATGMTFTGWSGGGCSGAAETCTVNPSSATTVTASFSGTPKPILSPTALTVSKGEGSGYGTVKAAGIACEALCVSATSLYQGTITEPKPKEAKTVVLEALSAPGSKTVVWSGCDSETEGKCVVTMSEAKEVTATFDELE